MKTITTITEIWLKPEKTMTIITPVSPINSSKQSPTTKIPLASRSRSRRVYGLESVSKL